VAAIFVLAGMAAVLLSLSPVYYEDYQLRQYVRSLTSAPQAATASDDALRTSIIARAHALDLPIRSEDVQISHAGGKLQIKVKYKVQMDFLLYQVDVHFQPIATSR
jgi:hypothetical protein